jgi:predicted RNA-binding Zn-ribbon protein involved in translation (DUF1610 family)
MEDEMKPTKYSIRCSKCGEIMNLKKVRGIEMYQCPHCGKTLILNESKEGKFKEENSFKEM